MFIDRGCGSTKENRRQKGRAGQEVFPEEEPLVFFLVKKIKVTMALPP